MVMWYATDVRRASGERTIPSGPFVASARRRHGRFPGDGAAGACHDGGVTDSRVTRGVFTFLFTDLVGSTERWEREPDVMSVAVARHLEVVAAEVERWGGRVCKYTGDGTLAVFAVPADAIEAASALQRTVAALEPRDGGLPVRMGVHTGDAELRAGDYYGGAVNLAARVMSAAHGGQILVTETAALLARPSVHGDTGFRDLGEHWLRGFSLPHRLLQVTHPELADRFPPPTSAPRGDAGPPLTVSTFVGRRAELAVLRRRVDEHRLVTVVGPAGVGKTRLAEELARRAAPDFPDGAWWCELAPVDDPGRVVHAVATALDVSVGGDVSAAIVDHLGRRRMLLVLDNCEHQVVAVRELVAQLLDQCPEVTVVATSQEALRLSGEQVTLLEPFAGGDGAGSSDAVELFLDRAHAAGASLPDDDATRTRIAHLCERLDGLALAIELAAARARSMTIDELERGLDERFTLLGARRRGWSTTDRHRTMRSAVQWSYGLLDDDEQRLTEAFGVFRGGFDLAAARAVSSAVGVAPDDTSDLLFELVEKSVVRPDTSGSTTRFTMLETVREFASERLEERGAASAVAAAHLRHYLDVAEQAERARAGRDERYWVQVQLQEFDNLRAAMACAESWGDLDAALRLYLSLYELASFQGRVEVFEWLRPARFIDADHDLVPAALAMSGLRHDPLSPVSIETTLTAIELQRERGGREHRILPFAHGFAAETRGDRQLAMEEYARAADVILAGEGPNGRWITARALVLMAARDRVAAEQLVADSREVGQPTCMAFALLALARATERSEPEAALGLVEAASALAATAMNRHAEFYVDLTAAGIVAREAGTEAAVAHLLHALDRAVELRQHDAMWRALNRIVGVLRRCGASSAADELIVAWVGAFPGSSGAARLRESTQLRVDPGAPAKSIAELVELTRRVTELVGAG
jgi:predicted ATPase/class 3 adenylate cyclase